MSEWKPIIGEILNSKQKPTNSVDKSVTAENGQILGHLRSSKGNSGRFAKAIFYFLVVL